MDEQLSAIYESVPELQQIGSFDQFKEAISTEEGRKAVFDNVPSLQKIGDFNQFSAAVAIETSPKEPTNPAFGPTFSSGEGIQPETGPLSTDSNESTGIAGEVFQSFGRGSARVGSMLAKTPAFLYDIAATPQNLLSHIPGLEGLKTDAKQFAEYTGLPENEIAKYYDNVVQASQAEFQKKYDKSLIDYAKDGDVKKFLGSLANQVAESAPITIGLMATSYAGASMAATTAGGAAVFGAGEFAELEGSDMSQEQKVAVALTKGTLEGFFESFGVSELGGVVRDILKKEGKEIGQKTVEKLFNNTYTSVLKKYLGVGAREMGGEMATQFSQNAVDKYIGDKPDLPLMEGVVDAGIVGIGSSVFFSTGPAAAELAMVKGERDKLKQIEQIKTQLEQDIRVPTSENIKKNLFSTFEDLTAEADNIVEVAKEQFESLSEDDKTRVIDLQREHNDIEKTLSSDSELSDDSKSILTRRLNEIDSEFDSILRPQESQTGSETETETTKEPQDPFSFIEDFKLRNKEVDVVNSATGETVKLNALEAQDEIKTQLDKLRKLKDCL